MFLRVLATCCEHFLSRCGGLAIELFLRGAADWTDPGLVGGLEAWTTQGS